MFYSCLLFSASEAEFVGMCLGKKITLPRLEIIDRYETLSMNVSLLLQCRM